jgi:hypothetical protein
MQELRVERTKLGEKMRLQMNRADKNENIAEGIGTRCGDVERGLGDLQARITS